MTKVLVVEDDAILGMAMEDMLIDLGCEVIGVASSEQAVREIIAEKTPDWALLDLRLNGTSAAPIATMLLSMSVRVVFCTGYRRTDQNVRELPEELSALPLLVKPLRENDLVTVLELEQPLHASQ